MCDYLSTITADLPTCPDCEHTLYVVADGPHWASVGDRDSVPVDDSSNPLSVVAALVEAGWTPVLTPDGRLRVAAPAEDELAARREQRLAAAE